MNSDSFQSVYREKLLEHLLVAELLKHSWFKEADLEVEKPEVDRSGYDIVFEAGGVIRHVQFKTSPTTVKTARQNISISLMNKPSACVIWTRFDPDNLDLGPFLYFGGKPGERLPSIEEFPVTKRTTPQCCWQKTRTAKLSNNLQEAIRAA